MPHAPSAAHLTEREVLGAGHVVHHASGAANADGQQRRRRGGQRGLAAAVLTPCSTAQQAMARMHRSAAPKPDMAGHMHTPHAGWDNPEALLGEGGPVQRFW